MRRRAALAVALCLAAMLPAAATAAGPDAALGRGDFAGSFGIGGGRTMYLECYGHGAPTVILGAGLRNGAAFWSDVQRTAQSPPGPTVLPGIARFTRVCAYDRPGTLLTTTDPVQFSRSSPVGAPRSASDAVSDLHALLGTARVPGPYVLVGHSYGGLIDRLYTATYPAKVAGLVQVDALPEFLAERLNAAQLAAYGALNDAPVPELDYPALEVVRFGASFAQMRGAARRHPLRDIPLSVISHGIPFDLPAQLPGGLSPTILESAWTHGQDRLARLTPDAVHVVAHDSSHYVMLTQPDLVIAQTRRVVEAIRAGRAARLKKSLQLPTL